MSQSDYELASTAGSLKSKLSNGYQDKDLIAKFDDKRRAKYSLLKELQSHDQGMISFS
jgi:hypothetical protein